MRWLRAPCTWWAALCSPRCSRRLSPPILEARYNAARDQIEVEIAYRGTSPDHDFSVQWGECSRESPARTVGRPAIVTLRLGATAHTDVFVPRDIDFLGGRPERPYDEIGRIEARGLPGEQRSYVR